MGGELGGVSSRLMSVIHVGGVTAEGQGDVLGLLDPR